MPTLSAAAFLLAALVVFGNVKGDCRFRIRNRQYDVPRERSVVVDSYRVDESPDARSGGVNLGAGINADCCQLTIPSYPKPASGIVTDKTLQSIISRLR